MDHESGHPLNAILVIDFTERLRAEGLTRREALLQAGPIRLRPVLMTSATMVVAMLPLALKLTVGAESRASIGVVVAGGMISSNLLSLILVPVVYSTLDDMKLGFAALRSKLFGRRTELLVPSASSGQVLSEAPIPVPIELAGDGSPSVHVPEVSLPELGVAGDVVEPV